MIFNSIKLSAARKKVAQLVEQQSSKSFPGKPVSLGIITDLKDEEELAHLLSLKKLLKIADKNFEVLYYNPNKTNPSGFDCCTFNLQDFDSKGVLTNNELEEISSRGVDLLITFAAENNTTAHLITAYFNAGLKVGRFQQNLALYDLILQTDEDAELFVEELLKYLKHLTKAHNE